LAKYSLNNFIGISETILAIKKQARLAANSNASMIISGETGTGKELIAQAIHALSARSSQKFVAVNVAAIPQDLVEVEFFGAVAGAYTGVSKTGRIGKMALANGGTLFLDEVADMPMSVQSKLLRALQEREVEPVGSNNIVPIDIRVIAATSLNLEQLIAQGKFRADLYYRLNVIPIKIPPLRARLADIDVLCESILEAFSKDEHSPKFISDEAVAILKQHRWPGNVRELKNVLQRASAMNTNSTIGKADIIDILASAIDNPILTSVAAQQGDNTHMIETAAATIPIPTLTPTPTPTTIAATRATTTSSAPSLAPLPSQHGSLSTLVAQYEKQVIVNALEHAGNNKSIAAQMLDIPRSSFYVKLKQYGIS
jgi:transcriptional regulator with PAS, ATPase and Fis domain